MYFFDKFAEARQLGREEGRKEGIEIGRAEERVRAEEAEKKVLAAEKKLAELEEKPAALSNQ